MRLAIISPVFPPYKGGIGAVAANDARLLRELGAEVTVFTPRYRSDDQMAGVARLQQIFSLGNGAVTPSLLWRLRGFDLIHLHYPGYGLDLFAVLAALLWRTSLVMTYHMQAKANDWRNIIFKLHRLFIEPLILHAARRVFVSSLDYAASINLKHPALVELPFGVDTARFIPGKNPGLLKELTIPEETCRFIFVGGLDKAHYFKGLDILLRAIATLSHLRSCTLLVVGDGSERQRFTTLTHELGLDDQIHFLGNVEPDKLPGVYQAADVHVLPSVDQSEAFGLVTLEAAASGLPSIVSDLPGVRTLVVPGGTGFLVPPGNVEVLGQKLKWFADPNNRNTREMMGQTARQRVEKLYDRQVIARRLMEAYKELGL